MRQVPEAVIQLLQVQHGVAARSQLVERGMSGPEHCGWRICMLVLRQ